jgi:hypothetical protein
MRRAALLALACALALAGCTQKLDALRGGGGAPEPYYKEYRDSVAAQQDKAYDVTLDEQARALNATITLLTRSGGVAPGAAPPAQLTLTLLAPGGDALSAATVDSQHPTASLVLDDPAERGVYKVRVAGLGIAAPSLTGESFGAAYILSVDVTY